jgi:hypothetical protein
LFVVVYVKFIDTLLELVVTEGGSVKVPVLSVIKL